MFVVSRRNVIIPGPGGKSFRMAKDYMGSVPAWAEGSEYLRALAADGKVILSDGSSDRELAAAERKQRQKQRRKEPPKEPEETPDAPSDSGLPAEEPESRNGEALEEGS